VTRLFNVGTDTSAAASHDQLAKQIKSQTRSGTSMTLTE
jgi:hypothetical protein